MTNITHPKSICILRLSAIGDVCHAIATVQAIQRRWPDAKLTWIIGKIESKLVTDLTGIEFIIFDKKAGLKSYSTLQRQLSNRHFDILLHMQTAFRASLASLCIRATEKWGFDRSRAKEMQWLFTNHTIDKQYRPHVAEGFWGFAKAISASNENTPAWQMPVDAKHKKWCEERLGEDKTLFVISPAASKEERNWLPERYAAVADYATRKGFQVVISGGPSAMERQLGDAIIEASESSIINLIGETSLPQLLAVLDKAELVLAPDSGPAHMATIVNTPVIGLYAHSNPMRTGPYQSKSLTVSVYEELLEKQTVKSINENPWGKRVKGDSLMTLITLEAVLEVFETWLSENNFLSEK